MTEWGRDAELLVELDPGSAEARFRVEGLDGVLRASARIVPVGTPSDSPRSLRLRPLVDPPGPFDADGLLMITPFIEASEDRAALVAFEARIGRPYYDFLLAARFRYAATCSVEAEGFEPPGTCAEVYRIEAATPEEARALDEAVEPTPEMLAIFEECRAFIVPGSHRTIWLVPEPS